jgi:hypothetical protein
LDHRQARRLGRLPSSKPPGPITFKHGLEEFHAIVAGWSLRDACIP